MLFFFSSRRRHTRLQGDWSSDVCSSDLWPTCPGQAAQTDHPWKAVTGREELPTGPGGSPRPGSHPDRKNSSIRTARDRKSTRLNSSHLVISYAVFCLKKKKHICILPSIH